MFSEIKKKMFKLLIVNSAVGIAALRMLGPAHPVPAVVIGIALFYGNIFLLALGVEQIKTRKSAMLVFIGNTFLFRLPFMALVFYFLLVHFHLHAVGICIGLTIGSFLGVGTIIQIKQLSGQKGKTDHVCCS